MGIIRPRTTGDLETNALPTENIPQTLVEAKALTSNKGHKPLVTLHLIEKELDETMANLLPHADPELVQLPRDLIGDHEIESLPGIRLPVDPGIIQGRVLRRLDLIEGPEIDMTIEEIAGDIGTIAIEENRHIVGEIETIIRRVLIELTMKVNALIENQEPLLLHTSTQMTATFNMLSLNILVILSCRCVIPINKCTDQ